MATCTWCGDEQSPYAWDNHKCIEPDETDDE